MSFCLSVLPSKLTVLFQDSLIWLQMNANNSWDHVLNICTKIPSSTSKQGYMPTLKHSGCPDYMLMVLNVGWALIPTPIT